MSLFGNKKEFDEEINYFQEPKCEWIRHTFYGIEADRYTTGCNKYVWKNLDIDSEPYCPCCGRKIEVKNVN